MVFRKEKGNEGFQRQFSALRNQLSGHADEAPEESETSQAPQSDGSATMPVEQALDAEPYRDPERHVYTGSHSPYATGGDAPQTPAVAAPAGPPAFDLSAFPARSDASVISHDAVWEGDLRTNGSLHVHGTVKGTLEATENVYIAEEADVDATVTAENVVIGGLVKGTIHCSARFEALATGRVLADVHAPSIVIHEGATMRGQFQMKAATPDEKPGQQYRRAGRHR